MAKFVGIYNNKGGVGKTTVTLFLADFLSSITIRGKKSRVLVIDFDPQSSCANAILGLERVTELKREDKTLSGMLKSMINNKRYENIEDIIFTREEKKENKKRSRKTKLGNLDVIVSDAVNALDFEEKATLRDSIKLSKWLKRELNDKYDFVFIDLPGNLSKINLFSMVGAFLSEYYLIPVEPNRINTNAIPMTKKMFDSIAEWKGKRDFKILGFILNKADKRTKQYKLHKDELLQFANMMGCKIYSNILPPTPKLANASDDSIEFITLSDRYDTYYTHVRKLVIEILTDLGYGVRKKR